MLKIRPGTTFLAPLNWISEVQVPKLGLFFSSTDPLFTVSNRDLRSPCVANSEASKSPS